MNERLPVAAGARAGTRTRQGRGRIGNPRLDLPTMTAMWKRIRPRRPAPRRLRFAGTLSSLRLALAAALGWLGCGVSSPPPPAAIRNVLLISMDTTRADFLGCYGFDRDSSPHIDELAREAVLFRHAVAPAPTTLVLHSTMLTGTNPVYHGVHDNDGYRLGDSNLTLAEILSEKGFATAAIVGSFVLDERFGLAQGFAICDDDFQSPRRDDEFSYLERRAEEGSRLAVRFLEQRRDGRFFLFLHFYDPHARYDPPEPFATGFSDNLYAGEIVYTDQAVGRVIDALKRLDLYDATLVILTSDHGESLSEHRESTHSYFIYQATQRVPLIIGPPGTRRSREVAEVVGLIDIVPTVLSLLGIDPPPQVRGRPISSAARAGKESRRLSTVNPSSPPRWAATLCLRW